jgi:hypothetical protein
MNYFEWIESHSSTAMALFTVAAFIFAAYAAGCTLFKISGIKLRQPILNQATAFTCGINLWGLIFYLLSICGMLNSTSVLFLLGSSGVCGLFLMTRNFKRKRFIPAFKFILPFVIICSPLLLFMMSVPLNLPGGLRLDELSYQITVPWRWLNDSFPHVYRDLPYSGFPMLPNFIFQGLMATGGLKTPRLLVFITHIMVFVLLYGLAARRRGSLAGIIFTLALMLSPCYIYFMAEVYVESFILMNLLAGFSLAEYSRARRLWLANGILAGATASVKLTGLVIAALIGLLPTIMQKKDQIYVRNKFRPMLLCAFTGIVIMTAFYLRPLLYTGNPCYPYMGKYFSSDPANLIMSQQHHAMGIPDAGAGLSWLEIIYDLSHSGRVFDSNLGWQFSVLLVLYILCIVFNIMDKDNYRRKRNIYLQLAIAGLLIFWYFTSRQARFLLPATLVIMQIVIHSNVLFSGKRRYCIYTTILAAILVSTLWHWRRHYISNWQSVLGKVDTASYLSTCSKDYLIQAFDVIFRIRGDNARTMVFFERRLLYLPGTYFIATPGYQDKFFLSPQNSISDNSRYINDLLLKNNAEFILFEKVTKYNSPALTGTIGASLRELIDGGKYRTIFNSPTHFVLQKQH